MIQPEKNTNSDSAVLPPFSYSIESGELAVRTALEQFLDALKPLELDVEECGTIELVLAEVLNNIVEHAYPPSEPTGMIDISCTQKPDGLMVHIVDAGLSMPDGKMPLGEMASVDVDLEDMPEGGFGWFLIQHLARDVTYCRVGSENHLKMRLAIGLS